MIGETVAQDAATVVCVAAGHVLGISVFAESGFLVRDMLGPLSAEAGASSKNHKPSETMKSNMKNRISAHAGKTAAAAVLLVALAACQQGPTEAELAAQAEIATLSQDLQERDSLIAEMALGFDEIEQNIAMFDEREKLLLNDAENLDGITERKAKLVRDVQLLGGLVQEGRDRIAELEKRLGSSKAQVGGLRTRLKEFEAQLADRDASLTAMQEDLIAKDFHIEQVTQQLSATEMEVAKREAIIEQQVNAINKAYLIVGTSKELEEKGVVARTGGVVGIGRTSVLVADAPEQRFKEVDMRTTSRVPLGVKKAELVTEHPKGSYELVEQDNELAYLEIKDPESFWKVSRYMVVQVK